MIRILLADDNALCRAGLRAMVDAMPDVDVVSEVSDGPAALRAIEQLRPDVALLGISKPELDGLEVATRVSRDPHGTRTILMCASVREEDLRRARAGGVSGYLPTTSGRAELEHAVREVARGRTWMARATAPVRNTAPRTATLLTPRLREILKLIADGLSSKEIAQRLDLSARTVEKHRALLMERLDIHTLAGLVRYAMRSGIVAVA